MYYKHTYIITYLVVVKKKKLICEWRLWFFLKKNAPGITEKYLWELYYNSENYGSSAKEWKKEHKKELYRHKKNAILYYKIKNNWISLFFLFISPLSHHHFLTYPSIWQEIYLLFKVQTFSLFLVNHSKIQITNANSKSISLFFCLLLFQCPIW